MNPSLSEVNGLFIVFLSTVASAFIAQYDLGYKMCRVLRI